jgi:hypothetical protein
MKRMAFAFMVAILAASPAATAQGAAQGVSGVHDFDFAIGTYHTHIRRLQAPLTGSTTWLTYDGIKTDVAILGGAGSVEQIEADGPSHLELMTLRLYDANARQWSLNFSSASSGQLSTPAIGAFSGGVGTFLSHEQYDGRMILVRQLWSRIRPSSYHFEQAFSADYGRTWETNFIADLVRIEAADRNR